MPMPMPMPVRHLQLCPPSTAWPAAGSTRASLPPSFCSFFASARGACGICLGIGGSGFRGGDLILIRETRECRRASGGGGVAAVGCSSSAAASSGSSWWDDWLASPSAAPRLSDVLWPSAGAFLAMALLGRLDQMIAPSGQSFTIAPLGAVCAVLFATPTTPGARKYNVFMAQIGCAAFGVLALSLFGPGWLARSTALAASIAFMIWTRAIHPPAASLPILFIDGAKFHNLHFWYALFPGATGCILLCLIQELVAYLKENYKF